MDGPTRGHSARPFKRGRAATSLSSSAAFGRKLAGTALFKSAEQDEYAGSEGDNSDGDAAPDSKPSDKQRLGKRPAPKNDQVAFSRDGSVLDSDAEAARKSRFEVTVTENRYQALKPHREKERRDAIAAGLIPDPLKPVRLDEAITFHGTCQDMCPEFEREEREFQKNVDRWELRPGTIRIDPKRAVKAFHRPAAGNEQPLPSDVRPPRILKRTLDYLFHTILSEDPQMMDSHPFLRDRTRAIRQDFTMQNDRSTLAIECHERIARYHILCLHKLREWENFSESQELEQLRKVLQSLIEFYDDARMEGEDCQHEAEFRAYYLLTHLRDSDTIRQTEALPIHVFDNPHVQAAITLHALAQRNNESRGERGRRPANSEASLNAFSRFFKAVASSQTSYLLACLAESHFFDIRRGALVALRKAFIPQHPQFPLSRLSIILGCDDVGHCAEVVDNFGLNTTNNVAGQPISVELHRGVNLVEYPSLIKQKASETIVEAKKGSATVQSVIDGQFYSAQIPPSATKTASGTRPVLQQSSVSIQRNASPLSAVPPSAKAISPSAKLNASAATFTPKSALSPATQIKLPGDHTKSLSLAVGKVPSTLILPSPSKPKSPLQPVHQRQPSSAETAIAKSVFDAPTKSPILPLAVFKREPISKSAILDLLWQTLANEAVNGFTTQAATSSLAEYHHRDFVDHDNERQIYLLSVTDKLRELLLQDCANRAASDIVATHLERRTMCRRSLHQWRHRLQQRRLVRERLRARKHRFSELVSQLPSSPIHTTFSDIPHEDMPDISMLDITRDGKEVPAMMSPPNRANPVRSAFWEKNTLADLINGRINNAFNLRANSAGPSDWGCIIEVGDLKSSIATWWRNKLGMRSDEDQVLHVLPNVRVRYELITVISVQATAEVGYIGLLLFNSSDSTRRRPPEYYESILRKSHYEACIITCIWDDQPLAPGSAVRIDHTDSNGGLRDILTRLLRTVRFNRRSKATRLQSLVSTLRGELNTAVRVALPALVDIKEDHLSSAISMLVDLIAEADRQFDRLCVPAAGPTLAFPAFDLGPTLRDSLLQYLTHPNLAGSSVVSSAYLYIAGQAMVTSAALQVAMTSIVESRSEIWSRRSLSDATSAQMIEMVVQELAEMITDRLGQIQPQLSPVQIKSPIKKRRRESGQLDETPKKQKATTSSLTTAKKNDPVSHIPTELTSQHVAKLSALIKETRSLLCK